MAEEVIIAADLLRDLLEEAAASPDTEVCGLLFGQDGRIESIQPTRNVAPDPARHFEIDPAALIAAHRASRGGGPAILGHYHSHPNGSAEPSPRDAEAAAPGSLWLILSYGVARLWRASLSGFIEVNLIFA